MGICNVIQAIDDLLTQSDLDALIPQFNLGNDEGLLSLTRDFDAFDQKRFVLRNQLETERTASLQNPAEIERLERELFNLVPPGFRFEIPHGKNCTLQFNIAIEDISPAEARGGRAPVRREPGVARKGSEYYGLAGWNAARAKVGEAQPFNATAGGLLRKIRELSGFIVTDTSAFCMTATLPQGAEIEFFHEFFSKTLGRERVSLFMKLSGTVRCCCFGASPVEPSPTEPPPTVESPPTGERPVTQDVIPSPPITEISSTPSSCRAVAAADTSFTRDVQSALNMKRNLVNKLIHVQGFREITKDTIIAVPSVADGILRVRFQITGIQGTETRIDAQGRTTFSVGTTDIVAGLRAEDQQGNQLANSQVHLPISTTKGEQGEPILQGGLRSLDAEFGGLSGNIVVHSDGKTVDFNVNLIKPGIARVSFFFSEDARINEFFAGRCDL